MQLSLQKESSQSWVPDKNTYWSLDGVTWFLSLIVFCYCISFITIRLLRKYDPAYLFLEILILQF